MVAFIINRRDWRAYFDEFGVILAQAQFITAQIDFDRVPKWRDFTHENFDIFCNAHIHHPPANSAAAMDSYHAG